MSKVCDKCGQIILMNGCINPSCEKDARIKKLEVALGESQQAWQIANNERCKLESEVERLKNYSDELAAGLPVGMLPQDVSALKEGNASLATEVHETKWKARLLRIRVAELVKQRKSKNKTIKTLKSERDRLRAELQRCREALESILERWGRVEKDFHMRNENWGAVLAMAHDATQALAATEQKA